MEQIALLPETVQRENYERRWPWWVPWSVEGASVALGIAATGIYVSARTEMKHYDQALQQMCPMGCNDADIPAVLKARAANARRNSGVAIGMWVGAGAVAIGGGVMAVMNRPLKLEGRTATPSLMVTRDYVGAGLSFTLE